MSPQGVRPTDQQLLGSGDQPKQNTPPNTHQQTKTTKTLISICVLQGSSAHRPFRACASRPAPTVPTPHAQTFVTLGWLVSCFLPGGESSSFASSTPGPTVVAQSARRGASLEADCVRRGDELALVWKPRRPWLDTPTGTRVYLAHRALVEWCSASALLAALTSKSTTGQARGDGAAMASYIFLRSARRVQTADSK